MNIGISTLFNVNMPFEIMIPMVKEAGFDVVSLAGGNEEQSYYLRVDQREKIKLICKENGVMIDSIHAPLAYHIDISSLDSRMRSYSVDLVKQTVDACNEIGCTILFLHLNNDFENVELRDRIVAARKSLDHIVPYAQQKKIFIGIENLFRASSVELFDHILVEYTDECVGICYDTSHAHLAGNLFSLLDNYGERIIAVHISDNRGQTDDHVLPYEGVIDWDTFARHFARINYAGTFLLEVDMQNSSLKEPTVFLDEAYKRAKKITSLLKKYKNNM